MESHGLTSLIWIGASLFLLGMSKGGFPVGSIALPMMILVWPEEQSAARGAVGFMLPMLCAMDMVAVAFYRRQIQWRRIMPLAPGSLLGVALGSILFVSDDSAFLAISDRALKLCIGVLGILFVLNYLARRWIMRHRETLGHPGWTESSGFGFAAGVTSTLAHAAGPLISMYFLPQRLPKLQYAGTLAAYFWLLNLVKLAPFAAMGRIESSNLALGAMLLPVIPVGVLAGYLMVRLLREAHYVAFIYAMLFAASAVLILKALPAG